MGIGRRGISLTWTVQLRKLLAQHPTTVLQPTVGAVGYYLGPRRHVIDTLALGDPLLARLPAKPRWRVGHYERAVPEGYVESVATDSNRSSDPKVHALYDTIRVVTRGALFTSGAMEGNLSVEFCNDECRLRNGDWRRRASQSDARTSPESRLLTPP